MAPWLYARLEGVGAARELDRPAGRDIACCWLAGGVPVHYHGLSDFRIGGSGELDRLLSESVRALVSEGLVERDEIAGEGTKVRAPASARSFTHGGRRERIERQAAARVERLRREVACDPAAASRRREKEARAKTHPRDEQGKGARSVSLTDPEARRMCFPDGAVRAGCNVQTAALPDQGLIVAVMTTDRRNDQGLACPLWTGRPAAGARAAPGAV